MKKIITIAFLPWLLSGFSYKAMAQKKSDKEQTETQEIIIRKKGDKDATLKLEFKDDEVLINGKSIIEFNEDEISINKRKIIINRDRMMQNFNEIEENLRHGFGENFNFNMGEPKTFLGVTTSAHEKGASIEAVTPNSPADAAGLEKDDIITKVESDKIQGPGDLTKAITARKKGDKVKISFLRDGKKKNAQATLGETEKSRVFTFTTPGQGSKSIIVPRARGEKLPPAIDFGPNFNWDQNGFRNFSLSSKPKLGIKIQDTEDESGVKLLEVESGSLSEKAGLKKDDILISMDHKEIKTTDDARQALINTKEKSSYPVKVKRDGVVKDFTINVPKVLKTVEL